MAFLKKKRVSAGHGGLSDLDIVSSSPKGQQTPRLPSRSGASRRSVYGAKRPDERLIQSQTVELPSEKVSNFKNSSRNPFVEHDSAADSSFSFEDQAWIRSPENKQFDSFNSPGGSQTPQTSQTPQSINTQQTYSEELKRNESRHSSGGSISSLSLDRLLCTWDVTDPHEWTKGRVLSFFKSNDFSDQWILYFRKHQLYGDKFLGLLAHENFLKHAKNLPQTENSSYNRFQFLLKRTLEQNVVNGHIRNKSDKSVTSRSSSDSTTKLRNRSYLSSEHSRSASDSIPSSGRKVSAEGVEERPQTKGYQKGNSASSLYRRSLISLRSSNSYYSPGKTESMTKPTLPRPISTIDSNAPVITESATQPSSSPLSPNYTNIFRRQHKSSSSESSIFNILFGSNSGQPVVPTEKPAVQTGRSYSSENLPASKSPEASASSPLRQNSWNAENLSSLIPDPVISSDTTPVLKPTEGSKEDDATEFESENPQLQKTQPNFELKDFVLEKKFYPLKSDNGQDNYVMVTKDNRTFIPINVNMVSNINELKESMAITLGISHQNFTVHLTDFGCEIGCSIPDQLLENLRLNMFYGVPKRFFIKDQLKVQLKPRAVPAGQEMGPSLRPAKSKGSLKSTASSMAYSNDGNSLVTSNSDVTSYDESSNGPDAAIYPQTPSYYYENVSSSNLPEVDYWNVKSAVREGTPPTEVPRIASRSGSKVGTPLQEGSDTTFKVIRKPSDNEINFDKRRDSPYNKADFAPRREAPKPPGGTSVSSGPFAGGQTLYMSNAPSSLHKRRLTRKTKRPPPPTANLQPSSVSSTTSSPQHHKSSEDSVVKSYTPASSHVLVPQPYRGASDGLNLNRTEDNSVTAYLSRQRSNRSGSLHSVTASTISSPPRLLTRMSSKRVVSSASAADNFEENDITFNDAPALSDSGDGSDDSDSSNDIIWSTSAPKNLLSKPKESSKPEPLETSGPSGTLGSDRKASILAHDPTGLGRKMTLRPSAEVVYQNLEKFFPGTDLDKPIVEGSTPPPSPPPNANGYQAVASFTSSEKKSKSIPTPNASPINSRSGTPQTMITSPPVTDRMATALHEATHLKVPKRAKTLRIIAREASEARQSPKGRSLKRKNTKMWGTRVVEVTDKGTVAINKTKNSNGDYKEFAWIKGEMIGKGSFGSVYLGLNVTTGEMIAVKQVEVPRFSAQDEQAHNVLEALKSEVSTLQDLDHLNIVQYLGFENKGNIYSLFLEYVAGGSVGSLIRFLGHFDEKLIRFLTVQVLAGLSYLHSRGILHRDMKADNILIDSDGVCKISDFGISKKSSNIYTNSDMTMRGTVFWMAPEMVDTKQGYSAKVDIWSLGCVVLEMFAGKRPWSNLEVVAAMFQIGKSKSAPPIPEDTLPLISEQGRDFLDACFEIDPERRPTADKLLEHKFCVVDNDFDFKETKLARFIKSNDKVNSSKLRNSSQ
ncbi:LAMI_0H07734g1_1 [Lachancea mirantina]|uniref:LAMI_0H07734g1_1 n=1 Tax=Lachancea mirantina TaxID=1230905 RepID=A0A1G4KG28_9SACH|nr:LAMI_0H07734g1_1 [Lachancea mirantina]